MMNKKIALIALLGAASFADASESNAAKGFYVGVQGGMASTNGKFTSNPTGSVGGARPIFNYTGTFNANGGLFGAMLGYNFQKGNFVFGLETSFGVDTGKQTIWDTSAASNDLSGYYAKIDLKRSMYANIDARLGMLITPMSAVFLKLGMAYAKNKATLTPSKTWLALDAVVTDPTTIAKASQVVTANKNSFTFKPGVAFEIYKGKVLFRLEYDYAMSSKITLKQDMSLISNSSYNGTAAVNTFNVQQHQIKLGVAYKF